LLGIFSSETLIPLGSTLPLGRGQNIITFQLTLEEGKFLVNLARQTVNYYFEMRRMLQVPDNVPSNLMKPSGVFVTLNHIHNGEKMLRGCIGLPYPTTPIVKAVIEAAVNAATQDPRFPPVTPEELDHIVFEVSVLTPPEQVIADKPTDYLSKIMVGRDGLIIENRYQKGLLLPQVPVELNWNTEEFLCQASMKAGISPDAWLMEDTKIYRFQAIVFEEKTPKGNIEPKEM